MPQLPRVAVLGPDLAGATALITLVDAGLDATGVGGALPVRAGEALAARGLTDRWLVQAGQADRSAEPAEPSIRQLGGAGRGFEISVGGQPVGRWDAVVMTGPTAAPGATATPPLFGGVFDPVTEGLYLVGARAEGAPPDVALARAQAGWVAEYLRGRYRLPTHQTMIGRPRLGPGWPRRRGAGGYLRALDRELRAGRARAAAAGYPLPLPAAQPA